VIEARARAGRGRSTTLAARASGTVAALLVALVTLAAGARLTSAQPAPPAATSGPTTAERERELGQLREQIAGLVAQLDDLAVRAYGIQGELEKVAVQRRLQTQRVAEARAEHDLAESRAADAAKRLDDLEAAVARERHALQTRLTGLYQLGRHGLLRLAFALDARADPLSAARQLRYLARRDAAAIERFDGLRAQVVAERNELEKRRAEAADWYQQQLARNDELRRLEARQSALLAGTRREGDRLADRALELADRESQLAGLLDSLYGRDDAPLAGRPMQEFRGHLDWPVRGKLAAGFGPRLDPRYGTKVPHNGIDIEPEFGAPVVAVYPGRVVFAAPFQSYGPTVVLQHAGRVFTLYAGLSSISVAKDSLVSLRQPLGRAGERIYFEVRVENRPEDPRRWIR
jgi:murein hydrolase activator